MKEFSSDYVICFTVNIMRSITNLFNPVQTPVITMEEQLYIAKNLIHHNCVCQYGEAIILGTQISDYNYTRCYVSLKNKNIQKKKNSICVVHIASKSMYFMKKLTLVKKCKSGWNNKKCPLTFKFWLTKLKIITFIHCTIFNVHGYIWGQTDALIIQMQSSGHCVWIKQVEFHSRLQN